MHWVIASLISALFLGVYDLCKRHAVKENAVLPVLFLSTVSAAVIWVPFMILSCVRPECVPAAFFVSPLTGLQHLQLFAKSAIVGASWIFSYFAMKHLPITLGGPIRSTGPVWTLIGAVIILGERPNGTQWTGLLITLTGFLALSWAGRREGVVFHKDKWVMFMIIGTLFGAVSGLYDKFLLGGMKFSAATVQAWFSIYLVVIFLPLMVGWKFRWWPRGTFHWRWSIVFIGLSLLLADYVYFNALRDKEALVALVSNIRRGSVLISFLGGIFLFHEGNALRKLPAVLGVLAGIWIVMLG